MSSQPSTPRGGSSVCPHVKDEHEESPSREKVCDTCGESGSDLWACQFKSCTFVGCGEEILQHRRSHYLKRVDEHNQQHVIHRNLTNGDMYCFVCEKLWTDDEVRTMIARKGRSPVQSPARATQHAPAPSGATPFAMERTFSDVPPVPTPQADATPTSTPRKLDKIRSQRSDRLATLDKLPNPSEPINRIKSLRSVQSMPSMKATDSFTGKAANKGKQPVQKKEPSQKPIPAAHASQNIQLPGTEAAGVKSGFNPFLDPRSPGSHRSPATKKVAPQGTPARVIAIPNVDPERKTVIEIVLHNKQDTRTVALPFPPTVSDLEQASLAAFPDVCEFLGIEQHGVLFPKSILSSNPALLQNTNQTVVLRERASRTVHNLPHEVWSSDLAVAGITEFVLTLLLVFVGCGTGAVLGQGLCASYQTLAIAFAFGFGYFVLGSSTFSQGGFMNPAITLALFLVEEISGRRCAIFFVSQFAGAAAGAALVVTAVGESSKEFSVAALSPAVSTGQGFLLETLLTGFVVLTSLQTVTSNKKGQSPMAIGMAVFVAHLMSVQLTGSSLNPARSFGPALVASAWSNFWIYFFSPFTGAVITSFFWKHALVHVKPGTNTKPRNDQRPPVNEHPRWQRMLAEAIGTLVLVYVWVGSSITSSNGAGVELSVAFAAGLSLFVVSTAIGPISGGDVNPAISWAKFLRGERKIGDSAFLVYSQLSGAVIGTALLRASVDYETAGDLAPTLVGQGVSSAQAVLVEGLLTFLLTFVTLKSADSVHGSLAMGLTVVAALITATPLSGGSLNPARSFGSSLVGGTWDDAWVFWVGPIVGATVAAVVLRLMDPKVVSEPVQHYAPAMPMEPVVLPTPVMTRTTESTQELKRRLLSSTDPNDEGIELQDLSNV